MANQEHVDLLKQGIGRWDEWRKQHPDTRPDLKDADLHSTHLWGIPIGVNLSNADLRNADLRFAHLHNANLGGADLKGARLHNANLKGAHLHNANLGGANLYAANLSQTNLRDAILTNARLGSTTIAYVDLRTIKGLAEIGHDAPSYIDLHSIQLPQDGSAEPFLRGCGVPDEWIDFWRSTMMHPIQYHSCFISYSSKDEALARRLHADLQNHGVRCWFAPEDLKIGDRFHLRINEAIHLQDKLLLLLSKSAIQSDWVEIEVRAALEKEQRQHRDVLFPVRLDSSVMETSQAWAAMLRQSRHIGDFTRWTDSQEYQQAFDRLLRDLKKADERQHQETK